MINSPALLHPGTIELKYFPHPAGSIYEKSSTKKKQPAAKYVYIEQKRPETYIQITHTQQF